MIQIAAAGILGDDASLRYTASGDGVLSFSVACRSGKDETTWLRCTLFGKRAETLSEMMKKGGKVTVFGSLKERKYTDNEGNKRSSWEATINEVTLQGGKPQGEGNADGNWDNRS